MTAERDHPVPRGIWAVASEHATPEESAAWARAACAAGAAALTFRRPRMEARAAVAAVRALRETGCMVAVHGAADVARAAGAHACIAGMRSLPVARLARAFSGLVTGASVHDAAEARAAESAGARFLVLGPVWDTPSKRGLVEPLGPAAWAEIRAACAVPVIAIGGVEDADQVRRAAASGAHGVAVLRAARDPERLRALARAWEEAAG